MAKGRLRELTPYGKYVKHKLIELNMTQVELAEMVGTSKQYLGKILFGERSGRTYIPDIERVLNNSPVKKCPMVQNIRDYDIMSMHYCLEQLSEVYSRIKVYNPEALIVFNNQNTSFSLYGGVKFHSENDYIFKKELDVDVEL